MRGPSESRTCVICMEKGIRAREMVAVHACGHVFHAACLLRWFDSSNTCPACRRAVPVLEEPDLSDPPVRIPFAVTSVYFATPSRMVICGVNLPFQQSDSPL